ncbi:MAG TPA: DUF1778 domain-containing protein [Hyphomicrobiaceae bacterium]|jgi:uncharacterized protein (DUF1778 family)
MRKKRKPNRPILLRLSRKDRAAMEAAARRDGKTLLAFVATAARQRAIEVLDGDDHAQANDQAGALEGNCELAAVG